MPVQLRTDIKDTRRTYIILKKRENFVKNKSTCILEGLRTSKAADALKENVVNGLDKVVEFTMVSVFESIS